MSQESSNPESESPASAPDSTDATSVTRTKPPSASVGLPPDILERLKISIPGYRLISVIGRGGQAIVFKAVQESTGKTVAVKLLKGGPITEPSARERFEREVRALAAIDHPNIVAIIDTGQTRHGHGYLVMKYIPGQSLKQLMEDSRLAPELGLEPAAMLRLFQKICNAVNAAHMKGITHRDLSPSNIIVDEAGEPHIVDFGLARTAFDRFMTVDRREITVTGQFLGKIAYASPEQAQGKTDQIDIRTDVYALGVILYQLLTGGRFPYEVVGNIADVLNNIVNVKPTPPSQVYSLVSAPSESVTSRLSGTSKTNVNPVIEAIVLKALEKNPADRYRNAGELAIDVDNYLGGQPTMAKVSRSTFPNKWWNLPKAVAASLLLLVSSVAALYWQTRSTSQLAPSIADGSNGPADAPINTLDADADFTEATNADAKMAIRSASTELKSVTPPSVLHGERNSKPKVNHKIQGPSRSPNSITVDLLAEIDLPQGGWTRAAQGGLTIAKGGTLVMRRAPEGEYDIQFSFTLTRQWENVNQKVNLGLWYKTRFSWVMGPRPRGKGSCGFSKVNGDFYATNNTTRPFDFSPNKRNDIVICVRKDSLTAYVNGIMTCRHDTDYSDMSKFYMDPGTQLLLKTEVPLVLHSAKLFLDPDVDAQTRSKHKITE